MSATHAPPYSGYIIARLRPALVDWIREIYRANGDAYFDSLSRLADAWAPANVAHLGSVAPADPAETANLRSVLGATPSSAAVRRPQSRKLIARESAAELAPSPPLRSLLAYYRIDVRDGAPGGQSIEAFVAQLAALTSIFDAVEREPSLALPSPPVDWEMDPESSSQLHTEGKVIGGDGRKKIGINCNSPPVWHAGFDGRGVGFVDIELGWQMTHPDLPAPTFDDGRPHTPFYNKNVPYYEWHGTPVLGIVVGVDNNHGIVGIAPRATFCGVASWKTQDGDSGDITNAILESLDRLAPGGVLLLEVQSTGRGDFGLVGVNLPVEVVDLWFDAIRLATASGVIVIEPAGNGRRVGNEVLGYDLDAVWSVPGRPARSLNRSTWSSDTWHLMDSGATMVSACFADEYGSSTLKRTRWANYGSRIDCSAWGEEVRTTDVGDRYGSFGGTSAASAIIAGAAILVQQMWTAAHGSLGSPTQIRAILSDAALGTKVIGQQPSERPSVQPDLGAIAAAIGASPDVFVRDHIADDGTVPLAFTSQSPDIVLRRAKVAHPALELGDGSPDQNTMPPFDGVVAGATNYIYVRMRNRNVAAATDVVARVYWAEASTLIVPTDWHFIGESVPTTVPGRAALQAVGPLIVTDPPITWSPVSGAQPPQMPTSHGCFIALLSSPADPAPPAIIAAAGPGGTPTTWEEFLAFIGHHNNAAWRNFNLFTGLTVQGDLLIANSQFRIKGGPRPLRFDFEVVQHLPPGVRARFTPHKSLVPGIVRGLRASRRLLTEDFRQGQITMIDGDELAIVGLALGARTEFCCDVELVLDGRIEPQPIYWALRQVYEGVEVGRVTFALDPERWPTARD